MGYAESITKTGYAYAVDLPGCLFADINDYNTSNTTLTVKQQYLIIGEISNGSRIKVVFELGTSDANNGTMELQDLDGNTLLTQTTNGAYGGTFEKWFDLSNLPIGFRFDLLISHSTGTGNTRCSDVLFMGTVSPISYKI